jgi:hypothetical protein
MDDATQNSIRWSLLMRLIDRWDGVERAKEDWRDLLMEVSPEMTREQFESHWNEVLGMREACKVH